MGLRDTTLAILAGGQGSRLDGAAKGLIEVDGRSCLARQLELAALFADVLLLTSDPRYARLGVRCVPDVLPWGGPVAGLHAALRHAPSVLLTACDMPFLTAPVLELLCESPGPAVVVENEPLPSLWRVGAGVVEVAGKRSLKALLETLSPTRVPEVRLRAVDPELRSLISLNSPEDLARHQATYPVRLP
ncbi:MAG: molybdenum cofactor guanylyltransferase [Myxococcaceae bacterium]